MKFAERLRKLVNVDTGECCKLFCCRNIFFIIAARLNKVSLGKTEIGSLLIHTCNKRRNISADIVCDGDCSIVAACNRKTAHEFPQSYGLSLRKKHKRRVMRKIYCPAV